MLAYILFQSIMLCLQFGSYSDMLADLRAWGKVSATTMWRSHGCMNLCINRIHCAAGAIKLQSPACSYTTKIVELGIEYRYAPLN